MSTTPWTSGTFYSFDTETTGADPLTSHIVTASLVKFVNGKPEAKMTWVISPAVDIPQEATDIHGLTTEWAREHGKDAKTMLKQIITTVAQVLKSRHVLVVYNAGYDLTLVEKQADYYKLPGLRELVPAQNLAFVIDPFVMAQGYETFKTSDGRWGKTYKLPDVCARYGVVFDESHDATADAVGAGELVIALVQRYDFFAKMGPKGFHALQQDWRTRMQDSLRAALDKKKVDHDGVDAGWPLHSSLLKDINA